MKKHILGFMAAVVLITTVLMLQTFAVNVVKVSSPEQLLNAIASNTRIEVQPGKYIFKAKHHDYGEYWWDEAVTVRIDSIQNLEIVGVGTVELALNVGTAPVIEIYNSNNITISNVIVGHTVPEYGCEGEGHCISTYNSDNITVNDGELYGCGIYGICASNTGNITVNNTIIRDCENGAVVTWSQRGNMTLNNCQFLRNTYNQYIVDYTACFQFSKEYNLATTPTVVFNNCVIDGNHSGFCYEGEDVAVSFNACTVTDNYWQEKVAVRVLHADGDGYNDIYFEDQKPVIINGRTLVPVRGIFECYALKYNVDWDGDTNTAIISNYDVTVRIPIGSNVIYRNDEPIEVEVPAQIIGGRTMLPVRAVAEAFNLEVTWDDATRTVLIQA